MRALDFFSNGEDRNASVIPAVKFAALILVEGNNFSVSKLSGNYNGLFSNMQVMLLWN